MKKAISVLIIVAMLFGLTVNSFAVGAKQTPAEAAGLRFNDQGKFRILILADVQDGKTVSSVTREFIETAVRRLRPDLILLPGDNIYGHSTGDPEGGAQGIRDLMGFLQNLYDEGVGAPVAATFGNHDDQSNNYAKEDQMKVYSEFSCNISIDEDLWVDGVHYTEPLEHCGTYQVPIMSSAGDKVAFNVWVFDTGSYATDGNKGYDHVRQAQLDWFTTTSAKYPGVNSIVVQHIIMPEIYNTYEKVPVGTIGAYNYHGTYYALPSTAVPGSHLGEASCCSEDNGGEYDALKAAGGVIACVSGHDHCNSFVIPNNDPDFPMTWINCPTCGVGSYGDTSVRGLRIIDLDESDTSTFATKFYYYSELMSDDSMYMFRYYLASILTEIEYRFINIWMQITNLLGISNLVA